MRFYKRNKQKEKETWHLWFAWYPVQVATTNDGDGEFVFFETVMRCLKFHGGALGYCWWEKKYQRRM
jgi:hypothetical protein